MGARRPLAALAVAALLLGGCGPGDQELRQQRLEEAVATTLEGPVAFNLAVDASDQALSAFGDAAGPLGALLAGSSAAGVIEGDRIALGLAIGGVDVLQVRVTAPGEQYVRFNLGAVAELANGEPGAVGSQLEEALAGADLEPDARDAVLAAARGEWVRLATAPVDREVLDRGALAV
ncbi:MAG: hypothetical protein KY434_10150, partial [Actinobacteria bacterium]|nr:hypothetical protein [Actinomycetota bacterium]